MKAAKTVDWKGDDLVVKLASWKAVRKAAWRVGGLAANLAASLAEPMVDEMVCHWVAYLAVAKDG